MSNRLRSVIYVSSLLLCERNGYFFCTSGESSDKKISPKNISPLQPIQRLISEVLQLLDIWLMEHGARSNDQKYGEMDANDKEIANKLVRV